MRQQLPEVLELVGAPPHRVGCWCQRCITERAEKRAATPGTVAYAINCVVEFAGLCLGLIVATILTIGALIVLGAIAWKIVRWAFA